jgi:tRNA pseudouridine32 synthase/23S rRNA pseudouridine746 synthase
MDLPILYRDPHYIVLNKPAGLKVHAGPGGGPCVEDSLPSFSKRKDGPWLAHRLDADTAGCLLVALRKQPLIDAQKAFAEGRVRKTYWAVVIGGPSGENGTISAPLAKITTAAGWHMAVRADGQPSTSSFRVMGRGAGLTWLELVPHTGRTHQLRVHCAHMGWPILGDSLYGTAHNGLHLISRALALPNTTVTAEAPPPGHMMQALKACNYAA